MAAAGGRTKECHYAVLGVEMDATDSEIRKAYRKSALTWHPDKNQHRVEEATERMKLVTEAYAVLSDSSERAWYDAHRDSILHGADSSSSAAGDSLLPNLFAFFSSSCFSGFADDSTGFFSVYARAFDSVARAESRHRDVDARDRDWPAFGKADTEWVEVAGFYRAWSNYASDMSFAWADEHRTTEAPNRYTRRWMERENAKAKHRAREDWTDRVRALVRFVRKRDPRVAAETSRKAEEREVRRLASEARAKQEAAAALAKAEALAAQAEMYRDELEAASGFRLADEGPKRGAKAASGDADKADNSGADKSDDEESGGGSAAGSGLDDAMALLSTVGMSAEEFVEEFEATRELLESDGGFTVTPSIIVATLKEDGTLPPSLTEDMALLLLPREAPPTPAEPEPTPEPVVPAAAAAAPPGVHDKTMVVVLETVGDEREVGKAAFIAAGGTVRDSVGEAAPEATDAKPAMRACRVCKAEFPDVGSLLGHIKETGHHKPPAAGEGGGAGAAASGARAQGNAGRRRKGKGGKTGAGTAAPDPACVACGLIFPTRSKLFRHLEETGHAASPEEVKAVESKPVKAKKKKLGRRKGQRGPDDG